MTEKCAGFRVSLYSKLGNVNATGDIETRWVEGQPINTSYYVFGREYTDDNGVRQLNGVFEDVYRAKEYMYKLAGQTVEDMLRKGWFDIKVDEKRKNGAASAVVTVVGKTEDGDRGWMQSYSLIKYGNEKEDQ